MAISIGRPILRFLLLGIVAVTCLSITWMILWTWNESVTRVKESPSTSILNERPYPGKYSKTVLEWLDLNESSSDTVPRWARAPEDKKPPRKAVSNWVLGTVPHTNGTTWSEPSKTTSQPPDTKGTASTRATNINGLSRSEANRFRQNSRLDNLLYPEASRLGFINDFEFMINRDVCGEDPVDLLVIIGSHPKFIALRKMLRETWGGPRIDDYVIKLVFFFGRPKEARVQQDLLDESLAYGDIIQGNFQDHYHNITYRDLMAFRWTWRQCPQARYVMRTDDDMVIDIDGVLQALETQMPKGRDYLACMAVFHGMMVLRQGQYAVSRDEHPQDVYKPYCQGWTYWLTPGTCKALDDMALKTKPFWMNDAYLTGELMAALGWSHRLLYVPYTNNMMEMIEFLECPFEERPLFALGPSIDIAKTRVLHKRFNLRAQKIGLPSRDPDKAPPGPYYQKNFQNCDSARKRRNRPPHPWVGSPQPGIGPLPSGIVSQQTGYPWQFGMTPQQPGKNPWLLGMTPQQPGMTPQQPGMTPQPPGMTPQQRGLNPWKSGMTPQQPDIAPQKPGNATQEPGMTQQPAMTPPQPGLNPWLPGITPQQPGVTPQQPGMTPQQPGLINQLPGSASERNPLIHSPHQEIGPPTSGIPPQHPGLRPQLPGPSPDNPGLISGNDKTHEPPPSLQNYPGLLYEHTAAHERVMQREAVHVIMPWIKAETSIPKEKGGKPEEEIGQETNPAHSYKAGENRPKSGLRTQQPKVVDPHQAMQSFQWPADDHHRQSAASLN